MERKSILNLYLKDYKNIIKLLQSNSNNQLAMYLGFSDSYLANITKKKDDTILINSLGAKLMLIINNVYHFIPNDLPDKIVRKILKENDAYLDLNEENHCIENCNSIIQKHYKEIFSVKSLKDDLSFITLQKILKLGHVNIRDFINLYAEDVYTSYITIALYSQNHKQEDIFDEAKKIRIWLLLGQYYNILNKQEIFDILDGLNMSQFERFTPEREKYHNWILEKL